MWNTIKSWFKKEKQMDVVDRVEPVYQFAQKQRTIKSNQAKTAQRTYTSTPPTQHVDTTFQDIALTYLLLDSFTDDTPSTVRGRVTESVSIPEPTQSYSISESSSNSYSSYNDSSSRYSSDSSSSSSCYDSGSSDSSSSYSSD